MRSFAWLLLPFAFVFATATALFLTPSSTGWGTHQALGLPPCLFHHFTGWPCPSCGLTTSTTHLVHGHFSEALRTHPLGPAIYLAWGLSSLWSLLEFFGRPTPLGKFLKGHYAPLAYGAMTLYFCVWGARLVWISTN